MFLCKLVRKNVYYLLLTLLDEVGNKKLVTLTNLVNKKIHIIKQFVNLHQRFELLFFNNKYFA